MAAIRTAFDKMCLRQVAFGLVVPRKPKRLPVILSADEMIALLQAAPSQRDKLLRGVMYHTPPQVFATNTRRANVGQKRIHFLQQQSAANCRCAKVTLSVGSGERPIYFTGITGKEVRRGYVTLDIPPLEQWSEPLSWLTRAQRERFEEPEFYELLQREISTRLCQLPSTPS